MEEIHVNWHGILGTEVIPFGLVQKVVKLRVIGMVTDISFESNWPEKYV